LWLSALVAAFEIIGFSAIIITFTDKYVTILLL
jgi:hypothetical protein